MKGKQELWMQEGGWWTSLLNYLPAVRRNFSLPGRVIIHDATLRDGEQTPGVVFRKEEKVAMAKALDAIGVDRIEAGMPAVSPEDMEAVGEIVKLKLKAKIMVFSRAMPADIDNAVKCGVWGVVLEVPSGVPRLKYQYNWTQEEVIERSIEAIRYAKEKGLYVCFFPFDGSRAEISFYRKLVREVTKKSRPDAITLVDTTGCILPAAVKYWVREVKKIADIPVEIHTHNDFGMSAASTLAAVEAGAEAVHVCVNGLGERCGNAALEEIVVDLRTLLGIPLDHIRFDRLPELCRMVRDYAGVRTADNKPIVGDLAFTRESGMGMDVFRKEPRVAFAVHPEFVGRRLDLVLGKKSGRPSIKMKLEELGVQASDEQIAELLVKVKQKGTEKKGFLSEDEFKVILRETLKQEEGPKRSQV
jgi:isopropylmalate/homocitrate/citramalate synthase